MFTNNSRNYQNDFKVFQKNKNPNISNDFDLKSI